MTSLSKFFPGFPYQTTFTYSSRTVSSGEMIGVGSDSGAITITLPSNPSANDYVGVWDAGDNAGTNNITIARNGNTIVGVAEDFVINIDGGRVDLIYNGTTWKFAYSTPGAAGFTGKKQMTLRPQAELQVDASSSSADIGTAPDSDKYQGAVYLFDAAAWERCWFAWVVPKSIDATVNLRARFIWYPTTTNTGAVNWGISRSHAADGEDLPNNVDATTVVDAAQGVANRIQFSDWASFSLNGADFDDLLVIRFYRHQDGNDNYTGDAALVAIQLEYTTDAPTDD